MLSLKYTNYESLLVYLSPRNIETSKEENFCFTAGSNKQSNHPHQLFVGIL